MRQCTEEMFLKDVAEHTMQVLHDDGVHRCLRFSKKGSSTAWFDVVTWPGFLAYTGDMGSFVFTRLEDMFEFFRGPESGPLRINPSYWGEKLEAVDSHTHHPGYKEYSEERLRENIEDHVARLIDEHEGPYDADEEEISASKKSFEKELRFSVESDVLRFLDDGEDRAREALRDFECTIEDKTYTFQDSWEWDCREFTFRYLWCCYALVWAIRQYDTQKQTGVASE